MDFVDQMAPQWEREQHTPLTPSLRADLPGSSPRLAAFAKALLDRDVGTLNGVGPAGGL